MLKSAGLMHRAVGVMAATKLFFLTVTVSHSMICFEDIEIQTEIHRGDRLFVSHHQVSLYLFRNKVLHPTHNELRSGVLLLGPDTDKEMRHKALTDNKSKMRKD